MLLLHLLCVFLSSHFAYLTVFGVSFSQAAGSYFPLFLVSVPVAKVGSVGFVSFLVEGTSSCVLVDEVGSCLSGGQVHVWWCVFGFLWPYYIFRPPLC